MTEETKEENREKIDSEKPAHPLIFVAPNGARRTKADHPEIPVSIAEIVATAKACFGAGADGIHAHVRDKNSEHILDAGLYLELLEELKLQVPEMAVQITTEAVGRYSPSEQRDLVRKVRPRLVSIALREMFEDDDLQAVSRFYYEMREQETKVQHIVYTSQEFTKLVKLTMLGSIPARGKSVLFVLGRYEKNQQSRPQMLEPFLSVLGGLRLAQSWRFMVCAFGQGETACLLGAAKAGGDCRVGFENNLLNEDGTMARNNEERVQMLVKALADAGISTGPS